MQARDLVSVEIKAQPKATLSSESPPVPLHVLFEFQGRTPSARQRLHISLEPIVNRQILVRHVSDESPPVQSMFETSGVFLLQGQALILSRDILRKWKRDDFAKRLFDTEQCQLFGVFKSEI